MLDKWIPIVYNGLVKGVECMKVLGIVGCVLALWGLIWGVFIRDFVWLAALGLLMMCPCLIWDDE